jgi:hypothetical protein
MVMTLQELQRRSATDEDLRAALKMDPRGTLAKEGIEIPDGVEVAIIEATEARLAIVIPPLVEGELNQAALADVSGGATYYTFQVAGMTSCCGKGGAG